MAATRIKASEANGATETAPPFVGNKMIEIPPLQPGLMEVVINGLTPLIVCAWSEKAKRMMLAKQKKEATKGREAKCPEDDYKASLYVSTEGWTGVPAGGIKGALVAACRTVTGLPMTVAKRIVFVQAQGQTQGGQDLVRVYGEHQMHEAMVRLESGVADIRFRARYLKWSIRLAVEFAADLISAQQVANLIQRAGHYEGLCEHRPGSPKNNTGSNGRFALSDQIAIS